MIRQEIANLIQKSIEGLQKEEKLPKFDIPKVLVEKTEEKTHGDYSTNIAMLIAKQTRRKPLEIAENLKSEVLNLKSGLFDKVEIAPPGFINFFLSKEYLQRQVGEILKEEEKFGQLNIGKNQKVQVEFISANPTGPLTVGNARGGPFGDVLGNVLQKAGFKVEKAYYINDYGRQILALGHSVLKDEQAQYKGDYINYLQKRIKEKDPYKAGEMAAKIIIEEMIKKTTDRMSIKYDEWFLETSLHKSGQVDKALEFLKKKDLIYEKEKAWWFRASKYGDERDRVVIKADGAKTYLAGDIAYHKYKFEKKKFDKVIDIWGADHYGDMAGLQGAVEALGHKGKLDIIILQFVTIIEKGEKKKISKRRGAYVAMDELLSEVGPDVMRFLFLQKSADTHLNFDLSLAKEQSEKNPVYYVQYGHARICAILRKCGKFQISNLNSQSLEHPSEIDLIKQLIRFPEIIEDAAKDYQIQRIPQYAIDLATSFHQFYRDCKVLSEDKELTTARLSLISATKIVLKNTLNLMGISAPERM
jgi:arginyl-tRNA synthetase